MKNEIVDNTINNNTFESIKHIDDNGNEYWEARELMIVLEYKRWDKFNNVIETAKIACKNSNNNNLDHFSHLGKMVKIGSKTTRKVIDYKLSRYACYLIAQNADSRKKVVALAQTYFAIQTRKMELAERDYNTLSEDEKRFYQRSLTKKGNYSLNRAARDAGVKNFDKFHNAGYRGLYNWESANDIHYEVGSKIRKTIKELGGTMPEDLPTPSKSLKELEKEKIILLKE